MFKTGEKLLRKTKIVCTIGPASRDEKTLREILLAGMNVMRLNFSHGTHEEHAETLLRFRKVRAELAVPAAVMLDTKGPEIRIKTMAGGAVTLKEGNPFTLITRDEIGSEKRVAVTYKEMPAYLHGGEFILLDDGKIVLRVTKSDTDAGEVETVVVHGGVLHDHKGINLPDVDYEMPYISKQDEKDLAFGVQQDVDYVAASFVRSAGDVKQIRHYLDALGGENIQIIAKIESTQGVSNFEEILRAADGIMVARGDLGVELAFERLPGIQKNIIRRCLATGKVVITATQMLESMISNPIPTRAETNDVANAVFDGTSCVMLSGETAAGRHPVEAVRTMAKIAEQAEKETVFAANGEQIWRENDSYDVTNAIAHGACTLAEDIRARAIIAATDSGFTASRMAKYRPHPLIIGATPREKTYHRMAMLWGVLPMLFANSDDIEKLASSILEEAKRKKLVVREDKVVFTAGLPAEKHTKSNMIRVLNA